MLCQLGHVKFESSGVNIANISRQSSYHFANKSIINGFDDWQKVGRHSQKLTLSGVLIEQSMGALNSLYALAEKKEPVTLALSFGQALTVLIMEISADQSNFLKGGEFYKQSFEVQLVVIHGNL
ncbi:phage tail protein [Marinomonas balearica]|uniref:Phage protein U n=1 Tax=Marinomonas balearica TaxID=491947 RepID=A0A4R6M7R2_9GAMM|nr:phage tail protein [Marinomonas balearica]TDO97457.1 phage protein U [Marinomonas balearica]